MWTRLLLIGAMVLAGGSWLVPPVEAGCLVDSGTYTTGTVLREPLCDTSGNMKVTGSATSTNGIATAAAPSYSEGSANPTSFDLSGNMRVTMGTLLSGEDQSNNLLMTNGGAVKIWTATWSAALSTTSASATSDVFIIGSGGKTPMASVTGTGAVTAVVNLYGDMESTTANGEWICSMELSNTTKDVKYCPQFTRDFPFYHVTETLTGTSAVLVVQVSQGAVGVRNPRFKNSGIKVADALIKTGPGILNCLIISEHDAAPTAGTISVNDATSAGTGTPIFEWILTTAVFTPVQVCPLVPFTTGLYFDFTTTGDVNVSASYE